MMNSNQKPGVSFALWIPTIWMIISASRSIAGWLDPREVAFTDVDYLSGSPIDRTVLSILIVIGILILVFRKADWSQILKSNAWIFLLFVYMGISIFWSDFQDVSFKRWIRACGTLIMTLVVLTEPYPFEAISRLIRRCAYVLLPLSIILIKYYRVYGVAYSSSGEYEYWLGVTTHKNSLGALAMIGGIYFTWSIMKTWGNKKVFIDILFFSMALYLLIGSKSMTSLYVLFVGIFTLLMVRVLKINLKYMGTTIFFIVLLFFLIFQLIENLVVQDSIMGSIIESSGRDTTLTGRTDLWTDLLDIASRNPIFGVGYGSFWIGDLGNDLWQKYTWQPTEGHNGYIDVYVELGLIGLFLLIMAIFFAYKSILGTFRFDFEYGKLRMILLVMIMAHNITESTICFSNHILWFIFLLVAVSVPKIIRTGLAASGENAAV